MLTIPMGVAKLQRTTAAIHTCRGQKVSGAIPLIQTKDGSRAPFHSAMVGVGLCTCVYLYICMCLCLNVKGAD